MRNGVEVIGGYSGKGDENGPNQYETILSGEFDNVYHVFYHPVGTNLDNTAKLTKVTITKGNANGSKIYGTGGGMNNDKSSPTLNNCIFTGNMVTAMEGGGNI